MSNDSEYDTQTKHMARKKWENKAKGNLYHSILMNIKHDYITAL